MLKSYKPDRAKVGSSQERPGFDHVAAFVAFMVEFWRECASFHWSTQVTHCDSFYPRTSKHFFRKHQ